MNDRSPAAKVRVKADLHQGAWWFGISIVLVLGAWILRKLGLFDVETEKMKDWVAVPFVLCGFYVLKSEVRKLIQEELSDESIEDD